MPRIDNLTGLRALAALWVITYHVNIANSPMQGMLGSIAEHGSYGVDIFFVLSGFVLSLVYSPRLPMGLGREWYGRFLLRRFAKVYPLHLLTFIAMSLLVSLAAGFQVSHNPYDTPRSALFSVLLLHAWGLTEGVSWNGPSWSVSAEWFAYSLMFPPMIFGLRSIPTKYIALFSVLLAATGSWASYELGIPWTHLTSYGVVRIVPEFLSGYLLFRLTRISKPGSVRGDWLTVAGIVSLIGLCFTRIEIPLLLIPTVALLIAGLFYGGLFSNMIFGNRIAILVGDASYSIYLIHTFVIIAANQVLRRVQLTLSAPSVMAVGLLEAFCAVAIGITVFRFVEEPLRQLVLRSGEAVAVLPHSKVAPDRMWSLISEGEKKKAGAIDVVAECGVAESGTLQNVAGDS